MAPTTEGEVTMLKVHASPGATIVPSVQLPGFTVKLPLKPKASNPFRVNGSVPLLVSVTAFWTVLPTGTLPRVTTLGESVRDDVSANAAGTARDIATTVVTKSRLMLYPAHVGGSAASIGSRDFKFSNGVAGFTLFALDLQRR